MQAEMTVHPWVHQFHDRIGFGLQVFPIDTPQQPAQHLLAAGRLAEELGYDAFFIGDHPAWALECWLHLAALAVTTQRIHLGSIVNCVSYRHPVMAARLAADLDNLSGGRCLLGLGVGWDEHEFANFGLPFPRAAQRQAALEEAIHIIRGVWGDKPFTLHGNYFRTTDTRVSPPPLQQPRPPLLIAGAGEKVTLRQVAQYADAANFLTVGQPLGVSDAAAVTHKLNVLRAQCGQVGRPYAAILRTHMTGWLILAEDEPRLQAKLAGYFPNGVEERYGGPWAGFVLAGVPASVVPYYQQLVDSGIQYIVVETLDARDQETIRLFAQQVAPRLKPV